MHNTYTLLIITIFLIPYRAKTVNARFLSRNNEMNNDNTGNYQGRWFPYSPKDGEDKTPFIEYGKNSLYDPNHGIVMGIQDPSCDDAKTNLEIDWDMNPENYTCFLNSRISRKLYPVRDDLEAILTTEHIPKYYTARHKCMDSPIVYDHRIPTFGTHRPLWGKWGEYTFIPRQRWLHNLEHGGIVMLYHPCADKNEVNLLRNIVEDCLYRHVITPYTLLTHERPLALVAWGRALEMSKVDRGLVIDFIRNNALNGAEKTARDGQYDLLLEKHADLVSDLNDSNLCPQY